jgi:hypothetical protein
MGNIISLDFTETQNANKHIGGFSLLSLNGAGLGVAAVDPLENFYGQELKSILYNYTKFLSMISFCEGTPTYENRITVVPEVRDAFGSLWLKFATTSPITITSSPDKLLPR